MRLKYFGSSILICLAILATISVGSAANTPDLNGVDTVVFTGQGSLNVHGQTVNAISVKNASESEVTYSVSGNVLTINSNNPNALIDLNLNRNDIKSITSNGNTTVTLSGISSISNMSGSGTININ
jgi:hypothetical protein